MIVRPAPRARLAAALLAMAPGLPAAAGAQEAPPPERPPVLGTADLRVALPFAAAGVAVAPFDGAIAERLQRPGVQRAPGVRTGAVAFRRYAQPVLLIAMPVLWAGGRLADDRGTAEAGLRATEAIGAGLVVTGAIKLLAGRERPYVAHAPGRWSFLAGLREGSDRASFPSGHTTVAFAAASALVAHAARTGDTGSDRWALGVPLYAAAGLAGLSRMVEDRHWASDVVGGALIGTVAGGAVVRWHATRDGSRVDRWFLGARTSPAWLGAPAGGGGAPPPSLLIFRR